MTTKLSEYIQNNGRLPPIALNVKPLGAVSGLGVGQTIRLNRFISYSFQSNILVPVDTFSFSFKNPSLDGSFLDYIRDGDLVELEANGITICTGIVDVLEIETGMDGEVVHLHGRDLLSQLEDQTSVNLTSDPIWGNQVTISQAAELLIKNTRIKGVRLQDAPSGSYLLATEPGESKISSLQRFLEPLNCIFWSSPDGYLVIGRPNMSQNTAVKGSIIMDRDKRQANVLSIKSIQGSTQIPNIVIPIWAGQESVVSRVSPEQRVYNKATGPARLRLNGHIVQRAIVISSPRGADPQSLSTVNAYSVSSAAGSNLLQAYAKREMARRNISENVVEAITPGHFNDSLTPFLIDSMYTVTYPRASINSDKMYLFGAEYSMSVEQGARTSLQLTQLGTIVSDIRAR